MNDSLTLLLLAVAVLAGTALTLAYRRRRAARRLYRRALENALADGMLTPDEIVELERIREDKDLSPAEVRIVAMAIYRGALRKAVEDSRLTPDEDESLARLQAQLGLSERDLGEDLERLARLRLLARVETGELPSVYSPIPLVPHETCHWVVQAALAERLQLPRRSGVELNAMELPVGGRKPFSVAGPRDALRPSEEILPVDLGMFVVTSRRSIFQGAKRTVSVPHARLDAVVLYADGLRLDELGATARGFVLVDDAEVTGAILLQAARRRREEIRPTRKGRSA